MGVGVDGMCFGVCLPLIVHCGLYICVVGWVGILWLWMLGCKGSVSILVCLIPL